MIERNALLFVLLTYSADKVGVDPWPNIDAVILFALAGLVTWRIVRTDWFPKE